MLKSQTLDSLLSTVSQLPSLLHHYTNLEAARQILASSSLWASHVHYMNDAQETFTIYSDFIEKMGELERDCNWTASQEQFFQHFLRLRFAYTLLPRYLISFSSEYDDLSQFRAYSKGGTGVCISFDRELLAGLSFPIYPPNLVPPKPMGQIQPTLIRCVYANESRKRCIIEELLESLRESLSSPALKNNEETLAKQAIEYLEAARPVVKNNSFRSENEWRLVFQDNPSKNPLLSWSVDYRTTPRVMVPFIKVPIAFPSSKVVRKILIGPCEYMSHNLSAMKKFVETLALQSKNVGVMGDLPDVVPSASSLRVL